MRLMMDRRQAMSMSQLRLLLLAALSSSHDLAGAGLVCRVAKESPDVVHEEGIQQVRNFLLVRKIQRSFKWNPGKRRKGEESDNVLAERKFHSRIVERFGLPSVSENNGGGWFQHTIRP